MIRVLFALLMIYGYGHDTFDGMRPISFNRPLQLFHADVNRAARDSAYAIQMMDGFRRWEYMQPIIRILS